ncbi:hypothetical protein MKW98_017227, partial [Papaver atlanticum]
HTLSSILDFGCPIEKRATIYLSSYCFTFLKWVLRFATPLPNVQQQPPIPNFLPYCGKFLSRVHISLVSMESQIHCSSSKRSSFIKYKEINRIHEIEMMLYVSKGFEAKLRIKIIYFQETKPLGTTGPLALPKDKLIGDCGELFFFCNSEVIWEHPNKVMIEFRKAHGGDASILVTEMVDDPLKYSVVVTEEATGKVENL